jgi:hypothetical protein
MGYVDLKVIEGDREGDRSPLRLDFAAEHACEYCKCCSCKNVCNRCRMNCSPTDSDFIPVIGCPDFNDMRKFEPVRYLYRSTAGVEYRICLPKPR